MMYSSFNVIPFFEQKFLQVIDVANKVKKSVIIIDIIVRYDDRNAGVGPFKIQMHFLSILAAWFEFFEPC